MSADTSLDWIARHPFPTTMGMLAVAVTLGTAWVYEASGAVQPSDPLHGVLLGVNVLVIFGAFIFGMYIRDRMETF